MLKKTKIICMLILTSSCGTDTQQKVEMLSFNEYLLNKVPSSVRPHFAEFVQYCYKSSDDDKRTCEKNLNQFSSLTLKDGLILQNYPNVIGVCNIKQGKYAVEREIILRNDYVDHDSLMFKALVWHELGHCLLDLDHVPDSQGIHIMNPAIPTEKSLGKNWSSYTEEMFNHKIKSNYSLTAILN